MNNYDLPNTTLPEGYEWGEDYTGYREHGRYVIRLRDQTKIRLIDRGSRTTLTAYTLDRLCAEEFIRQASRHC